MESIGDEKRIRALFSEVRLADEQAAPSFTATWHRAQARAIRPRAFNLSFVTATALLILAIGGLAVWSQYLQPSRPAYTAAASVNFEIKPVIAAEMLFEPEDAPKPLVNPARPPRRATLEARTLVANRRAEKQAQEQAQELASWQSPTASLLTSPSDGLVKSLPQLNENESEMKSFLPNRSNDKEK